MPTLSSRLRALHELHVRGLLTDEEFTRAKALVIAAEPAGCGSSGPGARPTAPPTPSGPRVVHPVVPGVGLALGAAGAGGGGLGA